MLNSIWSKGTWPGPSTITCTPIRQARSVSSPSVESSASWARSVASASPPGRRPSPIENVTSQRRITSQIRSHDSYIGFWRLCTSIHFASRLPPRLTMPISRSLMSGRCSRSTPAWIVK